MYYNLLGMPNTKIKMKLIYTEFTSIHQSTQSFNIMKNGNQKLCLKSSGLSIRDRFSCQKYMIHKGGVRDLIGNKDFRKYTFRNDRKNQRELGWKKCRRSYSGRSITSQTRCKFFFYINFDNYGFYVEPGYDNKYHSHHFPLNKNKGKIGRASCRERVC